MKFNYLKFPLSEESLLFGKAILRPIIPIILSVGDKKLRYAALIDSGADFCIFDAEVAECLGIDVRSGQKEIFGGIQEGGVSEAFIHDIILDIGGWQYELKASFSYDIAKHGSGILGQKGFFEHFVVKFDLLKEEMELKPRN